MIKKIVQRISAALVVLILAAYACFWIFPVPGQIPVLMYHFVGTEQDAVMEKNYVSQQGLGRQMELLKKFGFHVISMKEYEAIRKGVEKPRGREVVITFDDGHKTFETLAVPVLKEYNYPVILFLISDWLRRGPDETGSMTVETVKKLKAQYSWISLGSHTRTHPVLPELKDAQIEEEVLGAKRELEAAFGIPMDYFAYPTGNYDERTLKVVEEAGYKLAFTTAPKKLKGAAEGDFNLTRIKMSRDSENPVIFWFKLSGLYQFFKIQRTKILDSR